MMPDPFITLKFRTSEWESLVYWMEHYFQNGDLPEPLLEVWDDLNISVVIDNKEIYE